MLFQEIVICGCGNPLFADDGFGPAVVEELQKLDLPENVKVIDAGLAVRISSLPFLRNRMNRSNTSSS
jgi:hydrogenase maturation protease